MPIDGRTKEGRRMTIRRKVKLDGGFSVFWITDPYLARTADEMIASGEMTTKPGLYPWIDATLKEET